jgi:hypothetical protein
MIVYSVVASGGSYDDAWEKTWCAFVNLKDAQEFMEIKKVQELEEQETRKRIFDFHNKWSKVNPSPLRPRLIQPKDPKDLQIVREQLDTHQKEFQAWVQLACAAQKAYAIDNRMVPPNGFITSSYYELSTMEIEELVVHGL